MPSFGPQSAEPFQTRLPPPAAFSGPREGIPKPQEREPALLRVPGPPALPQTPSMPLPCWALSFPTCIISGQTFRLSHLLLPLRHAKIVSCLSHSGQGMLLFTDDVHPPPSAAHDKFSLGAGFKRRKNKKGRKERGLSLK